MQIIKYTFADGTLAYLGKVGEYNELICAGIALLSFGFVWLQHRPAKIPGRIKSFY